MSRNNWIDLVTEYFFPLYLVGIIVSLLSITYLFGYLSAVGGLYTLGGTIVAWYLYRVKDGLYLPEMQTSRLSRIAVIFLCAGIVISSLTREKVIPLLLVTVTGYVILSLQMASHPNSKSSLQTLATLLAVFMFVPLSKILTVEFYFGSGDIPSHVRAVQELLANGSVSAISQRGYNSFPGLHVITGTLSKIMGVTPHDGLLILGLFVYLWFLLVVYVLVKRIVNDDQTALFTSIILSTIPAFSYFSSYFFPQSFVVPILVCLLLVLHLYGATGRTEFLVASYFFVGAAVVSHHFSMALVAPVLLVMFLLIQGIDNTGNRKMRPSLKLSSLIVVSVVTLSYWIYVGKQFVFAFISYGAGVLSNKLLASTGSEFKSVYNYGLEVFYGTQSTEGFVEQLFTYSNLYYLVVFSLFTLGLVHVLKNRDNYRQITPWLVVSIGCGAFLFKTPLVFKSIQRVNHGLVALFALILGIGLSVASSDRLRIAAAVIILVLGVTGPVVAADNLYSIHSEKQPQSDFSEREYAQLSAVSAFSKSYKPSITTFWTTRRMLFYFGAEVPGRADLHYREISINDGTFLYRTNWINHRMFVKENPIYFNETTMTRGWIDTSVNSSNKVYDSGGIGLLWGNSQYNISARY